MKKIADAADPLYKTLDDGQKRRLAILTHHGRFGGERAAGAIAGWSAAWATIATMTGTATTTVAARAALRQPTEAWF